MHWDKHFYYKNIQNIKKRMWELTHAHKKKKNTLLCLHSTERTVLPEPAQTLRRSLAIVFFFFFFSLSLPLSLSPYQKMLLCKMSKKKEAREVISFSFLIASGIIGTLLGSLHELPASQKTAPTAPLHSCRGFEKYRFLW